MALTCSNIRKQFGNTIALHSANLNVEPGTIHALVGENGAGKSTLINILSGLLAPDEGALSVFGKLVRFASPLEAVEAGIGMVHQHFLLADALTVAENVALGVHNSAYGLFFNRRKAEDTVAALAAETGLRIDPRARVGGLPVGSRQRVEILKALSRGAKILLLDEPTAVLAPSEIDKLFETLRALRDAGRTIVLVTHKLDEVFALASAVTVLRSGQTVFSGKLSGLDPAALTLKMIGYVPPELPASHKRVSLEQNPVVLTMRGLNADGLSVESLQIRAGEIAGVAGVEGNGQEQLAAMIAGTLAPEMPFPGVFLNDISLGGLAVRERSDAGLAYIPSDRQHEGLVLEMSLSENLHLRRPVVKQAWGLRLLDDTAMRNRAQTLLNEYEAVPPEPLLLAGELSGGNQQKVLIARELSGSPKLILACNPTRGLDVGAAAAVHRRLLAAAREQKSAILLISSDLDEVLLLADRVLVLYRGKLSEIGPRGVSREAVGQAMVGAAETVA